MSVFVDPMMACVPNAKWRWKENCHLTADTEAELHDFAVRLGLKRAWFQPAPPSSIAHYDLTAGMRARAVKLGAIPITSHEMGRRVQEARTTRQLAELSGSLFGEEKHGRML